MPRRRTWRRAGTGAPGQISTPSLHHGSRPSGFVPTCTGAAAPPGQRRRCWACRRHRPHPADRGGSPSTRLWSSDECAAAWGVRPGTWLAYVSRGQAPPALPDRDARGRRQCLNGAMERFMPDYDPLAERATRDFVSRAMYMEIRNGNTSPHGGLYISMAHLGRGQGRNDFKGMVERCADCGFDLAGGTVEVVPTAHYMMGGVEFARRLQHRAAGIVRRRRGRGWRARRESPRRQWRRQLDGVRRRGRRHDGGLGSRGGAARSGRRGDRGGDSRPASAPFASAATALSSPLREKLYDIMWDKVGIIRDAAGLARRSRHLPRSKRSSIDRRSPTTIAPST